jgi:hypothetical protein
MLYRYGTGSRDPFAVRCGARQLESVVGIVRHTHTRQAARP